MISALAVRKPSRRWRARADRPTVLDMADVVFVLVTIAVFALLALIVRGAEKL